MPNIIAGVGIVLYLKNNPSEVVVVEENYARKDLGKKKGMYGLPSGHIEIGESILAAARREVKEETGIKRIDFESFLGVYLIKGAVGIALVASTKDKIDMSNVDASDISSAKFERVENLLAKRHKLRPGIYEVLKDYLEGIKHPLDAIRDCR